MFYNIIKKNVKEWINSNDCKIKDLINYIIEKNQLRDAQIEAVETYLFLKIKCDNQPLYRIFSKGYLNSYIDLDKLEISNDFRNFLKNNKPARMLYEISIDKENGLFENLNNEIKNNYSKINFDTVFYNMFYNTNYTDYIFSLPMGAGKTFLMAMFIYLDLYFATMEPDNKAFAHNFAILVPSGLKTSIVPSLKTIEKFDVNWIIPEPAATNLKKLIKFEILDANTTANKSNQIKNPNVNKISMYQPFDDLKGLVLVTNAEKVILDRIKFDKQSGQIDLFENSDDENDKLANELRHMISNLPNLSVFIDEVHHAEDSDIKLRKVVNEWSEKRGINCVIGFSGTPYLEKPEPVVIDKNFSFKTKTIASTVYYYPLINGINNFLKRPIVKSTDNEPLKIVEAGVKDFLDNYLDLKYDDGTYAKLAIYCGRIENLEENIYPIVKKIVEEYNLDSNEIILKYHKGNKEYPMPIQNQTEYMSLNEPISKKRIILLVQIGKEGWDCKSLTGVILSQKNDCPQNMVLQTSCRCLRQVDKNKEESAIIWLNEFNRKKLTDQLREQQNVSIEEFETGKKDENKIHFIDRTKKLNINTIRYVDINLKYATEVKNKATEESILKNLKKIEKDIDSYRRKIELKTSDIEGNIKEVSDIEEYGDECASYMMWLLNISKESMNGISINQLENYNKILEKIFNKISFKNNDSLFFDERYNINKINADIRSLFYDKYNLKIEEEKIIKEASILKTDKLKERILVDYDKDLMFPSTIEEIREISKLDNEPKKEVKNLNDLSREELIKMLESGVTNNVQSDALAIDKRNNTLHYMPYYFAQSGFEARFIKLVLPMSKFKSNKLEIYYNGEKSLTEFRISTYRKENGNKVYNGLYTPDFIILQRNDNGEIYKILIVETKGEGYKSQFENKKKFMETDFIKLNNKEAGYSKFSYVFIEDDKEDSEIRDIIGNAMKSLFEEEK